MSPEQAAAALRDRSKVQKQKMFEAWIARDITKHLCTQAGTSEATLQVLIKHAFEYGFDAGQANVCIEIVQGMMDSNAPLSRF